jgi:hypothetical protein
MWLDRLGWGGTPIAQRECIRLDGNDANGTLLAVSPKGRPIQQAWNALLQAGVTPVTAGADVR